MQPLLQQKSSITYSKSMCLQPYILMASPPFVHIPDDLIYPNDIFHSKKRYENEEQECEKICVLE